ncbi:MAG: hypothetical protein WCT03_19155 [Candidatus Obscuribacterales bacterium]
MESASNTNLQAVKPSRSRFLVALASFVMLSAGLASISFGKTDPADFPVNTWTTWAIKDFLSDQKKPDVVFMGSSLMLVPLDGTDADHLNRRIDGSAHHKSVYFEDKFKQYSGQKVASYNFALPGEMPSDAALITRFLLKGEKAPKVLVYGVGPRDFMDNLLPSPAATDPFQYLSRFGDWSNRVNLIVPQWQERLNYELGRAFYTYGAKNQLAQNSDRVIKGVLDEVAPAPKTEKTKAELVAMRRLLLPDYHPFEINRDECFFRPESQSARPKFEDNISEYRKRYKTLKMETFNGQMQFLADILDTAKERQVHVLLVAMPITDINRNLLSDQSWNLYRNNLRKLAANHQDSATFFDMQETKAFNISDFQDTVHLHSGGGAKLLDMIAKIMAQDKASMAALSDAKGDVADSQALDRFRQTTRQEAMVEQKESAPL